MKFAKKMLQELVWETESDEGHKIVEDNIIDTSRWSIIHELIFSFENKFYRTSYSVGATECQDESPFEYESEEIECAEVQPVEKVITVYVPVKS